MQNLLFIITYTVYAILKSDFIYGADLFTQITQRLRFSCSQTWFFSVKI